MTLLYIIASAYALYYIIQWCIADPDSSDFLIGFGLPVSLAFHPSFVFDSLQRAAHWDFTPKLLVIFAFIAAGIVYLVRGGRAFVAYLGSSLGYTFQSIKESYQTIISATAAYSLFYYEVFYLGGTKNAELYRAIFALILLDFLLVMGIFIFTFRIRGFAVNKMSLCIAYLLFTISVIFIIGDYAKIYMIEGILGAGIDKDHVGLYDAVYFSIITWTTVGYGDISPTPESRMFAASEALTGSIISTLVIGSLVALIGFITTKSAIAKEDG